MEAAIRKSEILASFVTGQRAAAWAAFAFLAAVAILFMIAHMPVSTALTMPSDSLAVPQVETMQFSSDSVWGAWRNW